MLKTPVEWGRHMESMVDQSQKRNKIVTFIMEPYSNYPGWLGNMHDSRYVPL